MALDVRLAGPADVEGVLALLRARLTPGTVPSRSQLLASVEASADAHARMERASRAAGYPIPWSGPIVWVVMDDGGLVAAMLAHLPGPGLPASIEAVAVAESAARRGIARLLVEAVVARARDTRCDRVELEVARSNAPARALYTACGFVRDGIRPRYYRDNATGWVDDAVLMGLDLDRGEGSAA